MSPLARYVIETGITLLAIAALIVVTLYGARRLGVGAPQGPLSLVGRLPIDARRAVYLVKVGETVYVLGASEAGLTKLGEITSEDLPTAPSSPPLRFADVLGKLKRGGESS